MLRLHYGTFFCCAISATPKIRQCIWALFGRIFRVATYLPKSRHASFSTRKMPRRFPRGKCAVHSHAQNKMRRIDAEKCVVKMCQCKRSRR